MFVWTRDVWFAAALLLVAGMVVVDVVGGTSDNLTGSLAVAPFFAASVCSARRTRLVSIVSVVAGSALLLYDKPDPGAAAVRITVLVAAAVAAMLAARARERSGEQVQTLTRVAELAQHVVLTPVPPAIGPFSLSSAYVSASREALIGGDLYGAVETERGIRVVVGDVRGKGLDAVQLAALVLSAFREVAAARPVLSDLVRSMDERVTPHLEAEDFVTIVLADIETSGAVEIVSCGHPPPVLVRNAVRRTLDSPRPAAPLGLEPDPAPVQTQLAPGDRLLFYTDGLVESRDEHGGFVDVDTLLSALATDRLDRALDNVLDRLRDAAHDVRDDLALLLVEYRGATDEPVAALEVADTVPAVVTPEQGLGYPDDRFVAPTTCRSSRTRAWSGRTSVGGGRWCRTAW